MKEDPSEANEFQTSDIIDPIAVQHDPIGAESRQEAEAAAARVRTYNQSASHPNPSRQERPSVSSVSSSCSPAVKILQTNKYWEKSKNWSRRRNVYSSCIGKESDVTGGRD